MHHVRNRIIIVLELLAKYLDIARKENEDITFVWVYRLIILNIYQWIRQININRTHVIE